MQVKPHRKSVHALDDGQLQEVARMFAVLSEPSRLRILQALRRKPLTVNDVVTATGMKQANVSRQLGILHQAGVLGRRKSANTVRYDIRMPLIFDLCSLVCDGLRAEMEQKAAILR